MHHQFIEIDKQITERNVLINFNDTICIFFQRLIQKCYDLMSESKKLVENCTDWIQGNSSVEIFKKVRKIDEFDIFFVLIMYLEKLSDQS